MSLAERIANVSSSRIPCVSFKVPPQAYALSAEDVRQLTHILARLGGREVEDRVEPELARVGGLSNASPENPLARAKWLYQRAAPVSLLSQFDLQ